jgi:hypothetical protein
MGCVESIEQRLNMHIVTRLACKYRFQSSVLRWHICMIPREVGGASCCPFLTLNCSCMLALRHVKMLLMVENRAWRCNFRARHASQFGHGL